MTKKIEEQIRSIEEEIRQTPHHKGTEHHIGRLRARLAQLRQSLQKKEKKTSTGKRGGYSVGKQGDATVALIGPPSAGKSTLLNILTGANSKVGDYAFTTKKVVPGILKYKGATIQMLDIPGLDNRALSVARNSDLVLVITDVRRLGWLKKAKNDYEFLCYLLVVNKIDLKQPSVDQAILVSAKEKLGLEELKQTIWDKLGLIRIYLKKSRRDEPNLDQPLIMHPGNTVKQAVEAVSAQLLDEINRVLIWGEKAKFPGQEISLDAPLFDEEILYFEK